MFPPVSPMLLTLVPHPRHPLYPALVPHESVRMRDQNNKRNTFASHYSRRSSICTTKKYLQNYVHHMKVQRNPKVKKYV